jgi:serine/threonine protein kinase
MSKVKIIDKKSEKSIKAEREFLSKLHHPFIVNMNCAFQDYENLYLVMDLLTGGDLRYHFCRIRRFTEEETKFFTSCLLLGLEYIHNNNIIHRDIKPENLVCDKNGYIRITDFGIAKTNKGDNSSETSGTPGYMAPEVLLGKNYTFTVDFFAIGVIGYEFMLGKRPYNGNNRKEIKNLVLKTQVKIDKEKVGWSEESVDFINRCLKRKESKRLGYTDGIQELKSHKWFNGFDWDGVYKKTILAPFVPKKEGNYDKSYCELDEKLGQDTKNRYDSYTTRKNYEKLFLGYTYVNLDLINCSINSEGNSKTKDNLKQEKKNNSPNKKEKINNNMVIKELLNKSKTLLKKNNSSNNNNIIINNYNNVNLNVSSLIMNKNYFSNCQKKMIKGEKKNLKNSNINPLNEQGINMNINSSHQNNNSLLKRNDNNLIKCQDFINDNINNISDKKIKKNKGLSKSPSILSLICTPQNGKKLKLEKNNSFLHLKEEVNLFSYNNVQNNNLNLNETNLSNLLSSNSILNLNNVFKIGHFNSFKNSKEKKKIKNSSMEQSFSFNKINSSKYHKNKRTNKNLVANYKKNKKKLSDKIKSKNRNNSLTRKQSSAIPKRNNSCLKLKFKTKNDKTFSLNSTLLSPLNKNDDSCKGKNINFQSTSNRRIKINKNANYIQLRQINKNFIKNKLLFYFPNWHKINSIKKKFSPEKLEELKKKGKIAMRNFKLKMMNNNSRIEKKKIEQMKSKQESMKMKRSISSLLLNNGAKLERKINLYINKNNIDEPKAKKINSINNKNNIRKKLIRNASDIFN